MKKNRFVLSAAVAILLAVIAVPAFAAEPMTISGVWETTLSGEKHYWYFSPGETSGKAVAVTVVPPQQVIPVHGTWGFAVYEGKAFFYVNRAMMLAPGTSTWVRFDTHGAAIPNGIYRFYTENGTEKMEYQQARNAAGDTIGEPRVYTKIGTKLSDLPDLGVLSEEGMTGGRFWAAEGIVVE
jgi:hypothetical protein